MDKIPQVNETIVQMVEDLKCQGNLQKVSTPLKRSVSDHSTESASNGETPIKKFKAEHSFNLSYVGSPREMNRLRTDLIEARNTIMDLQNRIRHMHNVRQEMQLMFDNETKSLTRQNEYSTKTIEELESQLQAIRKREGSLKEEISELKTKYESLKSALDEKVLSLEKKIYETKNESQSSTSDLNTELFELKRKFAELEGVLQAAEEDAEAQKKLAVELGKQLKEKNSVERELDMTTVELQKLKNQVRHLESAKEDYLEFQQQAKTQAYKLAKYVELEKENAHLKEDYTRLKVNLKNKLLLEEEVHDLKTRLIKHKELEKRVAELQAQCSQNQLYLNEWRAVARGICESSDSDAALPQLLRSAVERLQQQELSLLASKVDIESQLKSAQHSAKVSKAELEKNQKLLKDLKLNGDQKQNLIHRLQKKLLLISRERDSYRLQLDSYERDLTILGNATLSEETNLVQSQKERINNLEKIVEEYRDLVAKLENDLQEAEPLLNNDTVPMKQEQIAKLQDDVTKLREENEYLREQKDRLEIHLESLTQGNDTLQGGQVVHPTINPFSECVTQRQQKLEQALEENLRLKNKLKKIEEGIETSKLGDVTICPKEVESLKEQIRNNEKQTQKLKDYFKSSVQDFRNVVYMLFGYKVDRQSNSAIYKLRSMYAQQSEDYLCFQVNQEGELDLLENEYSHTLGSLIELHLIHQKSIPVFISAITMDLFNQRTLTSVKSY